MEARDHLTNSPAMTTIPDNSTARSSDPGDNYVVCPFTIIVDTREQHAFDFRGFTADGPSTLPLRPLIVPIKSQGLKSGDYSIDGYEERIAVERKSLSDLYSTLGQDRDRFIRELARLAVMDFGAVVVEASWATILHRPPDRSRLSPKSVYRSVLAWQQRYPRVHWWCCDTRQFAEETTLRILERYWRNAKAKESEKQGSLV